MAGLGTGGICTIEEEERAMWGCEERQRNISEGKARDSWRGQRGGGEGQRQVDIWKERNADT